MTRAVRSALMGATILGWAVPVAAQTASQVERSADDGEEFLAGNTIIVTARKREETLQDVPTTVAVTTAETIDRLALNSLDEIARTTPGLIFDDSFDRSSNRPVIRGQANILGQSGVAFFIDGIYYSGSLADYDVDTIERIEVVKGPQSALYGRNTYSGAINIISKLPTDRFEGKVTADIAEHDRYELTAGIRGPIGSGFSFGVNGRFYDFGGEYRNAFDGQKLGQQQSYSGSAVLRFDNDGPFTATLRGYYNRTDDGAPALFSTSALENNCFFDNGALYRGGGRYFCGTITPRQPSNDASRQFVDQERIGLEAETVNASLRLDYRLSDTVTVTSLTGYNRRDQTLLQDGDYSANSFQTAIFASFPLRVLPFPGRNQITGLVNSSLDFSFAQRGETEDYSQELRLVYSGPRVDALIGGYYYRQNDDGFDIRVLPSDAQARITANANAAAAARCALLPACLTPVLLTPVALGQSRNENRFDIRNIAAFGSLTVHVTDRFNIGVEGRYAEERIRQNAVVFNDGAPRPPFSFAERTFTEFTPRVTLDYELSPSNLLYAIYAEGQKPGGFNGLLAVNAGVPSFDAEDNRSYEIGSKNSFAGGRIIGNVALFRNEIRGYQLTQNVSIPPNQVSVVTNAGRARVNGVEVEFIARPARQVTFTANYALADSAFTSGVDENQGVLNDVADDGLVNCSTGDQFPAVTGCQSLFGSIVGKRIPRAPRSQLFADVDYRTPLGSGEWSAFAGGNLTVTSTSFAQVHNLAETGDATIVDLRLGVQNDRFKIMGYVKNLFDEDAVQQILRYADANNDLRRNFVAGLRPGRRIGLVLQAEF